MGNSVENEKYVSHRITHTPHGRTLNSYTVYHRSHSVCYYKEKMMIDEKNTVVAVNSKKFTVDIFHKKR